MSRNNPIPTRLREEFKSFMDANNFDDMPDGAWFYTLENAAQEFIDKYKLKFADNNTATHQYIRMLPGVIEVAPNEKVSQVVQSELTDKL